MNCTRPFFNTDLEATMRIKSITVRNYKIHREVTVELDPGCTVIGGPNECGKSTLAEAAHRAFFLKAKITGEAQRSMVSFVPGGQPEVEVCFETSGKVYRILKRFSGQTGMARLSEVGGTSWQDETAEEQLAKLLGVELAGGGRGAGDRAAQQWAHLWVWQGQAGNDPAEHANAQRDTLMSRLQTTGGAAVMQSALDAQVARSFTEWFESIFNRNGSPKINSDLGRAAQKEQEAAAEETKARETYDRLQQAISDYEQAGDAIETADRSLNLLAPQKEEVEGKLKRVAELRRDEQLQSTEEAAESKKHKDLSDTDQRIQTVRRDVQARKNSLAPKEVEATRLSGVASEKQRFAQTASANYDAATEAARTARLHKDLASAYEVLFEKTGQHKQLAEKAQQVQRERQTRSGLEIDQAKLPPVDAAKLKKLQKLETDRSNAESALNAMAARIEVISAEVPVKAGEKALISGVAHIVTEDTELAIGHATRLRIKPGGGTSLAEAREDVSQARTKMQEALDKLGLASLEAAAEALANREKIQAQIRDSDIRLSTLGADSIDEEVSAAQLALNNAQGEADRRKEQVPDFALPAGLAEVKELGKRLGEALQEKESNERSLKGLRDEAAVISEKAEEEAVTRRTGVDKENREIENLGIELGILTRTHGEDEARSQELARLLEAKTKAEEQLKATRAALNVLQPDLLNADKSRLERAVNKAFQEKGDAATKLAVAKSRLSTDGTADPAASLATAQAKARFAREQLANEQRRAKAAQMLHDLFLDEQRKLSEQVTRPLVEKVSGYLQCLFGAGAQAVVALEDNQFVGLQIARPGREISACQFDQLSGGAREQVAAAFRLAMAEVLSESRGNFWQSVSTFTTPLGSLRSRLGCTCTGVPPTSTIRLENSPCAAFSTACGVTPSSTDSSMRNWSRVGKS